MTVWRIALVRVQNYLRVRDVTITPDADAAVLVICGDNTAGKTSLLNALEVAIGGKARDVLAEIAEANQHVLANGLCNSCVNAIDHGTVEEIDEQRAVGRATT